MVVTTRARNSHTFFTSQLIVLFQAKATTRHGHLCNAGVQLNAATVIVINLKEAKKDITKFSFVIKDTPQVRRYLLATSLLQTAGARKI